MASSALGNPTELFSVKGMVALVTGGGTGIGLMITRALAQAGAAKVYIAGRRLEVLEQAAASVNVPGVVVPVACDVTSQPALTALAAKIEAEAGLLNLLFCNSGIGGPQVGPPAPGVSAKDWAAQNLAVPADEYARTFAVNAGSVWYTAMACLDLLDRGNRAGNLGWSSQVVVVSSIAGFNKMAPGGYAYGQSKAAATHVAKQLAVVLPTWGIRANCLAPGLFPSEMSAPIIQRMGVEPGSTGSVAIDTSIIPIGRTGDDADITGTVLFMVSRAGAYCNGNIVVLDGGRLGTFPSTM